MADIEHTRMEHAAHASTEQVIMLLHDPSPQIIRALLSNQNLSEDHILVIAGRKNLPADIFTAIFRDNRWSESYPIRRALASNPKTPISVALSIARYLRLFDLAEMARSPLTSLVFRHKVESIIIERVPTMPLGYKKSLAKMASGNVLLRLLKDPNQEVIALCLNNPRLLESHLYSIISHDETNAETIRTIARHPIWSIRSLVRLALVRNKHTPSALSERFLHSMNTLELTGLSADTSLPKSIYPLISHEFLSRGVKPVNRIEDQVFEIDENDDTGLENFSETEINDTGEH